MLDVAGCKNSKNPALPLSGNFKLEKNFVLPISDDYDECDIWWGFVWLEKILIREVKKEKSFLDKELSRNQGSFSINAVL